MDIIGRPPINPLIFFSGKISGYLIWILVLLSHLGIKIIPSIQFPIWKTISGICLGIGILIVAISTVNLGKSISLGLPEQKTEFKKEGIYRISRNPIYVGFDLLSIGAIFGVINVIVVIMGVYSIIVHHFIILGEERFLRERFGEDYRKYLQEVRRYI